MNNTNLKSFNSLADSLASKTRLRVVPMFGVQKTSLTHIFEPPAICHGCKHASLEKNAGPFKVTAMQLTIQKETYIQASTFSIAFLSGRKHILVHEYTMCTQNRYSVLLDGRCCDATIREHFGASGSRKGKQQTYKVDPTKDQIQFCSLIRHLQYFI